MSTAPTKSTRTPAARKAPAKTSPAVATSDAKSGNGDLGSNPAVLLAGGVAIGVVIGMLLPRLEREREALDPLGRKLAKQATAAAKAARETGKEEISTLLSGREAAKDRVSALFGNVISAAKEATKA